MLLLEKQAVHPLCAMWLDVMAVARVHRVALASGAKERGNPASPGNLHFRVLGTYPLTEEHLRAEMATEENLFEGRTPPLQQLWSSLDEGKATCDAALPQRYDGA